MASATGSGMNRTISALASPRLCSANRTDSPTASAIAAVCCRGYRGGPGQFVDAPGMAGIPQRDGGDLGDVLRIDGRQRDVPERRRNGPPGAHRFGPLEGVGVEPAGPQHGPFEPRPPYGVLEFGGMVAGGDALRGQQHDPPDTAGPDDVEDVVEVAALRHEVAGGEEEERFGPVEGGFEGPGCGEVGLVMP